MELKCYEKQQKNIFGNQSPLQICTILLLDIFNGFGFPCSTEISFPSMQVENNYLALFGRYLLLGSLFFPTLQV